MSFRNRKSNRNKRSNSNSGNSYQQLESRQLLAADLGLGFVSGQFDDPALFSTPDVSGAVGPNHIVEIVNGGYSIRDSSGTLIESMTAQEFFRDVAGADISAGTDVFGEEIQGELQDARINYDPISQRFFATAVVSAGNGSDLAGNDIILAISRTDNPIDGFRSVQFTGDETGATFNSFTTLGIDESTVTISTNNTGAGGPTVSVYSLPIADLLTDTPSIDNFTRFDDLDPAEVGSNLHFASDLTGNSSPSNISFGVSTFDSGNTISVVTVVSPASGSAAILNQFDVAVPDYVAGPDGRQPNNVDDLNNISPNITGSTVESAGFTWAVHTVEGSNGNSAIRWYQIDNSTLTLANTGLIEDLDTDFLYPSIAVNQFGVIAIGFTGVSPVLPASGFVQLGFSANGLQDLPTVTFPSDPVFFEQGLSNLVNTPGVFNPFGEYSSTTIDPDDPFSFFTFQEFVPANDEFGTAVTEVGITDISPVINADASDNVIVLRRNEAIPGWLEIEIDGNVTDTYEIASIDRLTLNLGDGNDLVQIDYLLGDIATDLGFEINGGGGIDEIDLIDINGHAFAITGDGSGTLDSINDFTGIEILSGSAAADSFTSFNSTSDWQINGEGGDDTIFIDNTSTGIYELRGSVGDDTYSIPIVAIDSITIIDSVGSENDTLVALGTIGDDTVLIDNDVITLNGVAVEFVGIVGIEQNSFDGREGDDLFLIRGVSGSTLVSGGVGDDTFDISSSIDSVGLADIDGELIIDGGEGDSRLIVNNSDGLPAETTITDDQIIGLTDSPITYLGNFGAQDVLPGVLVTGSDIGPDLFNVEDFLADNSLLIQAGAGNDVINVRASSLGDIVLDGGVGSDTFRTTFAQEVRSIQVIDTGSEGLDRFSIRATDIDDDISINNNALGAFGESYQWDGVENLVFGTGIGLDQVTVNNNDTDFIRVLLGVGDDIGTVVDNAGTMGVRFDGQDGSDTIDLLNSVAGTFIAVNAGAGTDVITVSATSFGRSRVDGQDGDDIVTVNFAARDARRINARDTGDGNDVLNVIGSAVADRIDIRPLVLDREGEFITYDANTELLDLDTFGSNDILNVFGSDAGQLVANLGVGNDTVNINSTATSRDSVEFEFSLGSGLDTANIFRVSDAAEVGVFGQDGADNFNVGSTITTDDGNLNTIRGDLFIGGGTQDVNGQDFLQVNDRGTAAIPYQYTITDSRVANSGSLDRPFDSFGFTGIEFVIVSGTDANNVFNVTASPTTVIRVDGNDNNQAGDSLNVFISSGDSQQFGTLESGFLTFTNGSRNVSFQEIESLTVSTVGATSASLADDYDTRDEVFSLGLDSFEQADSDVVVDLTVDIGF